MAKHKQFSDNKLSQSEEDVYLEKIFKKSYDKNLKEKYAAKLKSQYKVDRDNQNTPKKASNKLRYLGIITALAACFLAIFVAVQSGSEDLDSIVNAQIHEEIFLNKNLNRGDTNTAFMRNQAISAYNAGDMTKAIEFYSQIEDKNAEDQFFEGMAYLYHEDFVNAELRLSSINATDLKFNTERYWYLALCQIKLGENKKAIQSLNQVKAWNQKEVEKLKKLLQN